MPRRHRSSRRWALLLVAGSSLVLAAPAAAAPACPDWTRAAAWSPPAVVSPVQGQSENPRLAVRPDGAAIVAWQAPGNRILVARRSSATQPFGRPAEVGRGFLFADGFADGRPVVVSGRGSRAAARLRVSTLAARGWRSTDFPYAPTGQSDWLAFDARNDRPGVLAFAGRPLLDVVDLRAGRAALGATLPGQANALAAAVAPGGGSALIVRRPAADGSAQLAVLPRTGSRFGPASVLPVDPIATARSWLARTSGGASAVALSMWNLLPGAASQMRLFSVDSAGGVAAGPRDPLEALNAGAASDARGGLLAAWVRPRSGGTSSLVVADHPARSAGWERPRVVLRSRWHPHWPSVVRLADGRTAVAVNVRCGRRTGIVVLHRSGTGRWSAPEVAASWPGYLVVPASGTAELGADAAGRLTVTWPRRLTAGGGYRSIPIEVATRRALP